MLYSGTNLGFLPNQSGTDAEGKERPFILQQLLLRPLQRRSQDIGTLLRSIRAAEALIPRRTELYDLYEDFLSTDAHLRSVYEKRIMGVTGIDWIYLDKDGKEDERVKEFIDTPAFELLVSEIIKSKLWGYTMLELEFYGDRQVGAFLVPRKHMRPNLGVIAKNQTGDEGIYVREGIYLDTVLEAGDEKDLGLLMVAAQYVIFKRASITDWSEFAEVWGRPIIDAVWDGFDENQKIMLEEALEKMGGGGQIVRPAGTTINTIQGASNNPTGDLYKGIWDICNAEISKLFLGQTETTESSDSSGYAQAQTHAGTENDINSMDIKFVRRILNRRLVKILVANGIVAPGGSFAVKDSKATVSLKDRLDMDTKLKNEIGLPISDDYLYETYGIEKPEDYEKQKADFAQKNQAPAAPGFGLTMDHLMQLRDKGFFDEPRY